MVVSSFDISACLYAALASRFGCERVRGGFTVLPATRAARGARVNVALLSHDLARVIAVFECRRNATSYAPSARAMRAGKLLNAPAITVGGMQAIGPLLGALDHALALAWMGKA